MNCGGTLFNPLQASFGQHGWEPQASVKPGSWGGALGVMIRGPRTWAGVCFLRWEWVSVCVERTGRQKVGLSQEGPCPTSPPGPTHTYTPPHTCTCNPSDVNCYPVDEGLTKALQPEHLVVSLYVAPRACRTLHPWTSSSRIRAEHPRDCPAQSSFLLLFHIAEH